MRAYLGKSQLSNVFVHFLEGASKTQTGGTPDSSHQGESAPLMSSLVCNKKEGFII